MFCALVLALAYPLQQYFSQSSQIDKLKRQNTEKRAEVDRLRQELERWQDPDYVRIQARSRLHYVLPGETGLRLLGSGDAASGVQNPTSPQSGGPDAWYSQLWSSVTAAASTPATPPASSPGPAANPAANPSPSPTPSPPAPSSAKH
ncbi:MAG: septum formation initiator family protein [Catenulispora sp.]|nr:septum formation initiator family protein [Catenulispora sp.]